MKRRSVVWAFAGATGLAVFFASQGWMLTLRMGYDTSPGFLVAISLLDWWSWLALLPLIVWLSRRVPVNGWRLGPIALHVGVAAAIAIAKMFADVTLRHYVVDYYWTPLPLREIHNNFVVYCLIVAAVHMRDRWVHAARLETLLTQARLGLLQAQLQPHFLFNTLNAVADLVHSDPDAAERMIGQLGDLLRQSLRVGEAHEVSLGEELELLERYLAIQRVRFSDRLTFEVAVESSLRDARVPLLVLQPLVENAIRHGVGPKQGPGRVEIDARRDDGKVVLRVRDDGVGLRDGIRDGLGLANTRSRLHELYGEGGVLALTALDRGGVEATVTIPERR